MRYCRFQTGSGPEYGRVVDHDGQLWIDSLLPAPPEDLAGALEAISHLAARKNFTPIPLAGATLLAPVTPSKIVCVGRNYRDHAAELGNEVPGEPLLFLKPPSSLLAPGGTIRLPAISKRVDFEGELAIVIGKRCHDLGPQEDVTPYIRGYTIVNDVTARDLQKSDGQWSRAKGFDTFCPVGPIVTDEIDPSAGVRVETRLNSEIRQQGNTRDLIFPVPALLRHITAAMTLYPGDLVPTGTPAGVAAVVPGDVVEVEIEGVGTLQSLIG